MAAMTTPGDLWATNGSANNRREAKGAEDSLAIVAMETVEPDGHLATSAKVAAEATKAQPDGLFDRDRKSPSPIPDRRQSRLVRRSTLA